MSNVFPHANRILFAGRGAKSEAITEERDTLQARMDAALRLSSPAISLLEVVRLRDYGTGSLESIKSASYAKQLVFLRGIIKRVDMSYRQIAIKHVLPIADIRARFPLKWAKQCGLSDIEWD